MLAPLAHLCTTVHRRAFRDSTAFGSEAHARRELVEVQPLAGKTIRRTERADLARIRSTSIPVPGNAAEGSGATAG